MRAIGLGLMLLASAPAALAAEPYVTDDADIVGPGRCQLEAVWQSSREQQEWRALPACNPTGNLEIGLGRRGIAARTGDHEQFNAVQLKSLWRALEQNSYGLGWAAGVDVRRHPQEQQRRTASFYGSLLLSRSWFDDRLLVHVNAGARRDRDARRYAATGSIAAEIELVPRVSAIAETYDDSRSPRGYQAGLRFMLVPDHVDLNIAVGGEAREFRQTRYGTIALQFISPPVFRRR